jgi:hypothetical protein
MLSIAFKASNVVKRQEKTAIVGEIREEPARMVLCILGSEAPG